MKTVKRRWTEEEIDYLFEEYGKRSLKIITKNLSRSDASVTSMATRLGLQLKTNQAWFTVGEFCEVTKIARGTVQYWINNFDFPAKKIKNISSKYVRVDPANFWRWAAENKQLIQWSEFPKHALGDEPKWVREARKASMNKVNKRRPWTKWEIEELRYLLNQNRYTYPELSDRLNRSHGAIKRKIYDLELPWPVYINRRVSEKYTEQEIEKAIKLYQAGYPMMQIAKILGRTEMGLRGKIERSGYKITGRKLEKVE